MADREYFYVRKGDCLKITFPFDIEQHDKNLKEDVKADILKELKYLENCGMGKQKCIEHLEKILSK